MLDFYQRIEDVMITRFDARPHWAKYFHDYERVRGQYRAHLIDAERVRKRWDPQGRFMNGFLERMFAPFDEA